jgi:hypothetical protein
MSTTCQTIDKAFSFSSPRCPLSIQALAILTEIEVIDLLPVLLEMLDKNLLTMDAKELFYRSIWKMEDL